MEIPCLIYLNCEFLWLKLHYRVRHYENMINEKFITMNSRCEVQDKGVLKGYIYRSGDTTKSGAQVALKYTASVKSEALVCNDLSSISNQNRSQWRTNLIRLQKVIPRVSKERLGNAWRSLISSWRDCKDRDFDNINELNHHIEKHLTPSSDRVLICL